MPLPLTPESDRRTDIPARQSAREPDQQWPAVPAYGTASASAGTLARRATPKTPYRAPLATMSSDKMKVPPGATTPQRAISHSRGPAGRGSGADSTSAKGKQSATVIATDPYQLQADRIEARQMAEDETDDDDHDSSTDMEVDQDVRSPTMEHQPAPLTARRAGSGYRSSKMRARRMSGRSRNVLYDDVDAIVKAKREALIEEINVNWAKPSSFWPRKYTPKKEIRQIGPDSRMMKSYVELPARDVSNTLLEALAKLSRLTCNHFEDAHAAMAQKVSYRIKHYGGSPAIVPEDVEKAVELLGKRSRRIAREWNAARRVGKLAANVDVNAHRAAALPLSPSEQPSTSRAAAPLSMPDADARLTEILAAWQEGNRRQEQLANLLFRKAFVDKSTK